MKTSLCSIFNSLEAEGYKFVNGGGVKRTVGESESLFTFAREA